MQRKSKDFEAFHQRSLRAVMIEERRRLVSCKDDYHCRCFLVCVEHDIVLLPIIYSHAVGIATL